MRIELQGVGKRFRNEWVLRKTDAAFESPGRYAVTGPNGSGKSTLLRILSGQLSPSKGKVHFFRQEKALDSALVYRHIAFAAPYMELIEEFSLTEAIEFHHQFKPLVNGLSPGKLVEILGLQKSSSKQIRYFSSGMKQRLRLALAICSQSDILLLDEPGSNLDAQGMDWYHTLISEFGGERLIIVASNVAADFSFCPEVLEISCFK